MKTFEQKRTELIDEIDRLHKAIGDTMNYYVDESYLAENLDTVINIMKTMLPKGSANVKNK